MPFRLYIVPVIGTGVKGDPRRPKYFADLSVDWSAVDFGFEPVMFVGATLSVSDDNAIVGQADVTALPFDLAPTLTGGQVNTIQSKLEALNIPAGWVNTSLTWLLVVRTVLGMFSYLQRFSAVYAENTGNTPPSVFTSGVTLNTTFGSLPLAVRTAMVDAAQSFGFSTSGLTANTTLRVILKALADNFQEQQYNFNGTFI